MPIAIRYMLWSVLFAVSSMGAIGRADVAVVRPASSNDPSSERAQAALVTALERAGVSALPPEQVRRRLEETAGSSCLELDCIRPLLRTLGADMIASVTVSPEGEVLVVLADAAGEQAHGQAQSVAHDISGATDAAVRSALSRWQGRGLVTLVVDGSPQGATVLIDGQPRGMLPLELRVQPGTHEVTLSMEGYESASEEVQTVEPAPSKVSLHLTSLTDKARAESRRLNRTTLIGSTALMGAGAVTLAVALGSLAGRGCTERASTGECMEERVVAPGPLAAWTTLGAAALLGGATWLVVAKLKLRQGRETQLILHAGIGQLALTGRFP